MAWYNMLQKLWIDYLVWVRDYLYALIRHGTDLRYIENRFTRIISDFSNFLTPYYGEEATKQFEDLLMQHIRLLSEFGATVHSAEDYVPLRDAYYSNANDIARFLAGINPNWEETAWQEILQRQFYLEEYLTWLLHREDYDEYISQYDNVYASIQQIISYMIDGIAKQFSLSYPSLQSPPA